MSTTATDEFLQSLRQSWNEPTNTGAAVAFWGAVVLGLLVLLAIRLWRHHKKRQPK